jgi:AbiU2
MSDEKEPSKDLISAFEAIEEDVLWLHAKWQVFRQLFGKSEKRVALLNNFAPDFFQIVHDSILYDIFLTLSRLTDPPEMGRWKNLTFKRLANMLETAGRQDLVRELAPTVDRIEAACKPIRPWRNKLIAHKDFGAGVQYAPDPLPGVSRQMVEEALVVIREFMNHLHMALKNAETEYADIPLRGDGDQIVWYLKEAGAYHKHRISGKVDPEKDGLVRNDDD